MGKYPGMRINKQTKKTIKKEIMNGIVLCVNEKKFRGCLHNNDIHLTSFFGDRNHFICCSHIGDNSVGIS